MGKMENIILKGMSGAQKEAASVTGCDILVRAGAGSGKTKTLVARYLLLLDNDRELLPSEITAVTFTRKAAREMQSRIRARMSELAASDDPEEKRYWTEKLSQMDSANIGTIHSLCGRILRAHPAEAGLDPIFTILEENNAALLITQVVDETISRISSEPGYEALLRFFDGDKLRGILAGMLKSRSQVDELLIVEEKKTVPYLKEKVHIFLSDSEIVSMIEGYRDMLRSPDYEKIAGKIADRIRLLVTAYDEACREVPDRHPADTLQILYGAFDGWDFKLGSKPVKADAMQIRGIMRTSYPFLTDADHDIAWYKIYWDQYDEAEAELRRLWPGLRDAYLSLLDAAQAVDFDAMESLTLRLLQNEPAVREAWSVKIRALLVDEFQDTNDLQTELFSLLDPAHDRLFAVGDKKQSIYGFRGTNVALFDLRGQEVLKTGGRDILLNTTYRTDPDLLPSMGGLLDRVMADPELADHDNYAAYEPMSAPESSDVHRENSADPAPFIEILLADAPKGGDASNREVVGSTVAERLAVLTGGESPIGWDDIAILCRASSDFKQFETALEAAGIPYVTVAGQGYYDRPEIRDILNILQTAENPHDNAAFTGFLFSPCIGFPAEMIAALYRHANRGGLKLSFWQAMQDPEFRFEDPEKQAVLDRARRILSDLIRISGQVPLDEALQAAYSLTGMRTMLALDSGDRGWLNLDKLLPTARESGMTSVSEFLQYLEGIKETGAREGEAPVDSSGAVTIMTIHQAKGLEFPVIVVADDAFGMHSPVWGADPDGAVVFSAARAHPRYTDAQKIAAKKEKAEWLRLFYVAATRARNRLILCGPKPNMKPDAKSDTWLKRALTGLPTDKGEYTGPAWGIDGTAVNIRIASALPEIPLIAGGAVSDEPVCEIDPALLKDIEVKFPDRSSRPDDHSITLTVGTLVHKGIELWRFPDDPGTDGFLNKALLQSERFDPEEREAALLRAKQLLARFRNSGVYTLIKAAPFRRHEVPFSVMRGSRVENGKIDLLLRDDSGYTVIDFKTDALNGPADLNKALGTHSRQIEKYRHALKRTLGQEPRCMICFLDYCGSVHPETVGRSDFCLQEDPFPELPPEDDLWFEEDL